MSMLPFISDADLKKHVGTVLASVVGTQKDEAKRLHKNTIDPFSALFDAITQGITLKEWMEQEKSRQNQKTLQNALGDFHQNILGSIAGWKNLGGKGGVSDVESKKMKILAEIKNKFNTTKGNHRVTYYDDFNKILKKSEYSEYTAYFVEVISAKGKRYNKPFVPSHKGKRRSKNENIRVIDGKSFYALATGDEEALSKLYKVLPRVIDEILGRSSAKLIKDASFQKLFDQKLV